MATITHTDYLAQVSGSGLAALPGLWIRLRNNSTSTDYFSTAVSDATGAFTHSAVPGDYSAYTGTAATVVGTPTLRNAHYAVPVTAGDDAVFGSATTVVVSPYTPTAAAGAGDFNSPVRIAGGRPWADPTHPKYGCVGDGTTNDYAPASGSGLPGWMADLLATQGVGFLPAGKNFRTSNPIQIWQASGVGNIWIMGSGMTSCGFTVLATDYGNFINDFIFTGPGPSWIVTDCKFSDFKIDGQARNGAAPASRCGGISFGARTRCERVWLDDINWLAWSMRNSTTPDDTKIIDCRSSRGNAQGSDNISGGFNLQGIYIVHHRWDSNLACLSCFDFVPAQQIWIIDCENYSTLSIIPEACTNLLIIGLISTGGGGINIQSDQGYAFPAGTTNCRGVTVTDCIIIAGNITYQGANFQCAIMVNFGKGGAATVLGYGIAVDHNTIIGALLCAIVWLNNDSTYSSGGNSCDHNTIIDCNANNSQVGVSILGTSTVDGGVGIFFAHGGSPGDTCLANRCVDQRGTHFMRHGYQFGQSNGGAASQAGSGLYIGLQNRSTGTVAAGSNYYVPGTLITVPSVRTLTTATGVTGAQTPDPSTSEAYFWVLSGAVTVNAVVNPLTGMELLITAQQDGAGGRTFTWNAQYDTNWQPTLFSNSRSSILLRYDGVNALWRVAGSSIAGDQVGNLMLSGVGHMVTTAVGTPATSATGANVTSVTFTGNDLRGKIVIVMSGALAANTRIATCTWLTSFLNNAPFPVLVNETSGAGLANVNFYSGAESITAFDLFSNQALAAGTYTVRYWNVG